MTKKYGIVIGCLVVFALLLSGCKMPASQPPTEETDEPETTPIRIQTDSPQFMTQTAAAKSAQNETEATEETEAAPTPTNTPEPTEVIPVPTVTTPAEYTLKDGEFLFCIARRFNVNPEDLLALNGIAEGELLSAGTEIQIPQTGSWPGESRTLKPHPTTHTVTAGETVYSIACEYGDVTPEAIIAVNQLEEPYDLSAGQTLQIP
ncbi:MAG: LysM peptidoglycan-binding domain-containing protein [Brevefilum sp.]